MGHYSHFSYIFCFILCRLDSFGVCMCVQYFKWNWELAESFGVGGVVPHIEFPSRSA